MLEQLEALLAAINYEMKDNDELLLNHCISKVTNTIKNDVNCDEIPDGLMDIAINMVLGEFLSLKKVFDPDSLTGLDLTAGIKSLSEGDKNTTFATGDASLTDEQRLDNYISYLINNGRDEFSCYRRLRWE